MSSIKERRPTGTGWKDVVSDEFGTLFANTWAVMRKTEEPEALSGSLARHLRVSGKRA